MFAKRYAEGDITQISTLYGLATNKTMVNGDFELSITQQPNEGESKIFNDILTTRDKREKR